MEKADINLVTVEDSLAKIREQQQILSAANIAVANYESKMAEEISYLIKQLPTISRTRVYEKLGKKIGYEHL